ncbi:hypothetical protein [Gorillibacterium massiliense]|uniref:hypothetical protein n=1 Tax=Gorillibacterium massiliense TaxID=1280390 RepID=UPI0004B8D721|nr:hypothetical protein [Gorillibacterium massiliense]
MLEPGDGLVFLLVLVVLALWLGWGAKRWWMAPPRRAWPVETDPEIPVTDAVELLERNGYEVMTVKRRIPLSIKIDGGEAAGGLNMESRLYIDHFARKDDKLYIVKIARERMPLEWTGSGLRDRLLVYGLVYEEASGILYVEPETKKIRSIEFEVER